MVRSLSCALLIALQLALLGVSFVQGDYVAAVVQHAVPPRAASPFLTKVGNLHQYAADTIVAKAQGAQIIAFPEFGLTADEDLSSRATTSSYAEPMVDVSNSTDSGDFANPCLNPVEFENSPSLYYGSCMARNNSIVVLINTFEQVVCNSSVAGCPKDGQFVYVTDVVFDEEGNFVAKYRKSHPFYIFSVDAPAQPSMVTYKASFGVTFGMFICFDIAFPHPALDLVHEGVTDFLYAAAIGTIGKGTVAKLWSWANHVNVLLANHGNTASDIIIKGSSAQSQTYQVPNSSDSVVIATVPSA